MNGFLGIQWLSWSVAMFAVLAVAFGVMLRMTPLGRSLYAIRNNQEAAFHAGISVKQIKLRLFVLSGVVCAAVGMLYAFELSSAGENIGIGFEFQVITIVLLGGVSIFGGTGTILGVALAAFVYAGLRSALLLTSSFNKNDFPVVSGGLLILSVLIPNVPSFVQRLREIGGRRRLRGDGGRDMASARVFAAVDLGAEWRGVVTGRLDGESVALDVVHRFANRPVASRRTSLEPPAAVLGGARGTCPRRTAEPLDGIGVDAGGSICAARRRPPDARAAVSLPRRASDRRVIARAHESCRARSSTADRHPDDADQHDLPTDVRARERRRGRE